MSARIDWMHPSYRDLVIDELARNGALRRRFLRSAGLEGVRLALSVSGGAEGSRRFPLMVAAADWEIVAERCNALISDERLVQRLLAIVLEAFADASDTQTKRLRGILQELCKRATDTWNSAAGPLSAADIKTFHQASLLVSPLPPMPDFTATWQALLSRLEERLKDTEPIVLDFKAVSELVSATDLIAKTEPRFLVQHDFPEALSETHEGLLKRIYSEVGTPFRDDSEELDREAGEAGNLKWALRDLSSLTDAHSEATDRTAAALEAHAESCREQSKIHAEDSREPYEEDARYRTSADDDSFDVIALFADL
jgi:hypothetical protein